MHTKTCECGDIVIIKGAGNCKLCEWCSYANKHKNARKEVLFSKWAQKMRYTLRDKRHGEMYMMRKEYNEYIIESGGLFDDRIDPEVHLGGIDDDFKEYYQNKLDKFWLSQLDKSIKAPYRHKALAILKGRGRAA